MEKNKQKKKDYEDEEEKQNLNEKILYINFNQDYGCITCGTENGFKIYKTYPLKLMHDCPLDGGIGMVEMLYTSNIIFLVGGGSKPKYSPNKVMLWDLKKGTTIGEISFRSKILAIKLKTERIVVVLEQKVLVYNFNDLKLVDYMDTTKNVYGLASLNTEGPYTILAVLDIVVGQANIIHYDTKKSTKVKAHQSAINNLQLNPRGTKLATASQKGNVVRLYDSETGKMIQEVTRDNEYAQIYSLAFDYNGLFLASSCDSDMINIFAIKQTDLDRKSMQQQGQMQVIQNYKNPTSIFSFLKICLNYFKAEWSLCQCQTSQSKSIVAFGSEPNTILIISYNGTYQQATFNPEKGGDCKITYSGNIFSPQPNLNQ